QLRAELRVERLESLLIADALAIRRVRRDQPALAGFVHELRKIAPFEMNMPSQFRALRILDRSAHRARVRIEPSEDDPTLRAGLAFRTRFLDELAPQRPIVTAPSDEAEV